MSSQLGEAILEQQIRTVNFFNGRLLSAEDLRQEQNARLELDSRIAKAVGEGVVSGLEVEQDNASNPNNPVLKIMPGLAINRRGRSLELYKSVEITLKQPSTGQTAASGGFKDCQPLEAGVYAVGTGMYLLVIAPTQEFEGRAAVSGLGNATLSCNSKSIVEGVQFRLISLGDIFNAELIKNHLADDLKDELKDPKNKYRRNLLAYLCLGDKDLILTNFRQNPFSTPPQKYGLLDTLRPNKLTNCDVPLAVLDWSLETGIQFIDLWSVRRRTHRLGSSKQWNAMLGDRVLAEAEARLHQFEDTLVEWISTGTDLGLKKAAEDFRFLPPAGLLPIGQTRIKPETFFNRNFSVQVEIARSQVRDLLERSLYQEPLVFSSDQQWTNVKIYKIKDNAQLVLYCRDDLPTPVSQPPTPPVTTQPKPGTVRVTLINQKKESINPIKDRGVRVWVQTTDGTQYEGSWEYIKSEDTKFWLRRGRIQRVTSERTGTVMYDKSYRVVLDQVNAAMYASRNYKTWRAEQDRVNAGIYDSIYNPINLPKKPLLVDWEPIYSPIKDFPDIQATYKTVFIIADVPAGPCTVLATAEGYGTASEHFELGAGDVFDVELTLPDLLKVKPGLGVYFRDQVFKDPGGIEYKKIVIPKFEDWIRYPPKDWGDPRPEEFPIEIVGSVEDLLQGVLNAKPELGFTVSEPKIVFKAGYDPSQNKSSEPYAYLVTKDGQGIPVITVTADTALPGEVSITRSSVPDLKTGDYNAQLGQNVLGQLDVFANAWGGLVADQLGTVSAANATDLIVGTRASVEDARTGFAYYSGMSEVMSQVLADSPLNNDAALAKATPEAINDLLSNVPEDVRKKAGLFDITAVKAYATRLIDQARAFTYKRQTIPLNSAGILDVLTKAELQAAGIDMATKTDATDVAKKLGILDAETKKQLEVAGFGSVDAVANATATELAKKLSIPKDKAQQHINAAMLETLVSTVGLPFEDAQRVSSSTDIKNLRDLSDDRKLNAFNLDQTQRDRVGALGTIFKNFGGFGR